MLQMYVMDQPTKWEDYLHLLEFAYNNNYQASIKMSLFEALYGRKWHTPLSWSQPEDRLILRTDLSTLFMFKFDTTLIIIQGNLASNEHILCLANHT